MTLTTRPALLLVAILVSSPSIALGQTEPGPVTTDEYNEQAEFGEGPLTDNQLDQDIRPGDTPFGTEEPLSRRPQERSLTQGKIEEIVVQARRRDEFIEDTPVAVTALSAEALREANIVDTNQIQELVPNMQMNEGFGPQVRIRGVGTTSSQVAFDPGVGVYIDGVFIPRRANALLQLVDVQQVEVLRGPQGTLFGKNTVGGAINTTTVKPHMDLEAYAMVRPYNRGVVTRSMVNLPLNVGGLEDQLAIRLSLGTTNDSGYVYNSRRDEYLSGREAQAFYGALRFEPLPELTIDVTGTYTNLRSPGYGSQCVYMGPDELSNLAPTLPEECRASEPFRVESEVAQLATDRTWGLWGTIGYDFGEVSFLDDVYLKSLTAWRQAREQISLDLDATRLPTIYVYETGPGLTDGKPRETQLIQQELQANATAWDGRINMVGGLFTFWDSGQSVAGVNVSNSVLTLQTVSDITADNFSWALYTQATADVTDWLSLTAGIRYTWEEKKIQQQNFSVFTDDENMASDSEATGGGSGRQTYDAWTPMASVAAFAPDSWLEVLDADHIMAYFTYARGFRAGGVNASTQPVAEVVPEPFQPENADNFEFGLKTIAFDHRLTANLALFRMDYTDIQVTQQRTFVNEDGIASVHRITLNAADATNQGVELELQGRPLPGLVVIGTLGYLDATYGSFPDALSDRTGDFIDRSGERLLNAPKWQTYLALQYSLPVAAPSHADWLGGWLTPRLEWSYRSEQFVLGPEAPGGVQGGYNIVNALLSYRFMEDQRAEVALWGRNLTDEAFFQSGFGLGGSWGTLARWFQPPRTFGGQLSYRFG